MSDADGLRALTDPDMREALVEAMIREVAQRGPRGGSTFDLCADAVIRVLAGKEAEQ